MRRKLQGKRWLPVSLGAMVLAGAALAGTAHDAGASPFTAHRGVLPPGNPARSMTPETPLLSSCGAGDNGSTCNQLALTAIGLARPAMGSVPRRLPGGGRTAYAGSMWSGGWINALGADYAWMYDDGPGGSNLACRTGSSRYCWGHLDVLLTNFGSRSCHGSQTGLAMGTGHADRAAGYGESDTALMTGVCGPAPSDAIFTWARAKRLLGIR